MKTGREAGGGQFAFIHVNDGTAFESIQVCKQISKTYSSWGFVSSIEVPRLLDSCFDA